MANWYGSSRSNYFKVKDVAAFKEWATSLSLVVWPQEGEHGEVGTFAISPSDSTDGYWPSERWTETEDEGNLEEIDFVAELSKHLAEDSIAVLQQIGAEKLRYLTGWALAVNHKDERVEISIDDIYELAHKKFGILPTTASY